jgi:hypothetical protein
LTSKNAKNDCFFHKDFHILKRTFTILPPPEILAYKYGKYLEIGFNTGYKYLDVSYNIGYGDKIFSNHNININKPYLTSTLNVSHDVELNNKLILTPHINYSKSLNGTYSNQFNIGLLITK